MTFPYQPTQIAWHFLGLFPDTTVNPPPNGYDSTWVVNGRQLFRYKLPSLYSVAVPGTYPIQVVATNPTPDGCGGEQEIDYDLQIFDQPIATFSFSNNGCVYDTVQFTGTASNTGGRPVNIWSWNFGDASTAAIQNPRHKYIAQGSYTVKFSLITDVGCLSDTASSVLQLTDQPLAKFGNTGLSCAGQQITFSDSSTVTAGAAITKWYWDFGDGGQSLLQNPTHTYNSPGSFTVTLKVETTTGCQSITFSKTIVIHAPPVASFNFGNACLPTGTAQFTDQSTISDGTQNLFTYSWNFGDGGTSAQQNPVHNYSATGPFNVVLTVTSNNGCIDDTTRVMNTIYPQPVADFTATPEVCNGTAVNINDQSSAPNNSVAQWVWNFGDATGSSQQNPPPHLYATAGSYNITLTVTSAAGCVSAVATKTIVVDALPTANFTASAPACVSRDINFTSTSVPNSGSITKWTWDFGDGTNTTLNNGTAFTHSYTAAGSYTVTLQVETDKGCVSTIFSKIISVNVLPKAGFISPEVCLTDPLAPFVDTSSVSPGSIVAWNWNFGDTNANAANPNTSAQQNPSHRYIAVGTYTATLVAISDKGCTDTIAQSFVVNGSIPVANFLVQNANALCSNRTVTITDASTVDFGSIVKQEIYWDYANDPTIKTVNDVPVAGQNYTHAYPPFTTPATKTVSVRMVSYSGITCLSVVTRTITLLATPAVEFDAVPGICADAPSFQITQAFITNGLPGTGTFSGTGVTPTGIFSPSVATAGSYTIHYVYNAANGCSDSKDQTIEVFPVPAVTAGPDRFALEGGSVDLLGSGSGNNVSYLWTPDLYIDDNTLARPKVSPPDDMFYTLTVTSADGCKASDEVFVKVLKKPVIPNIFSPNGDGIHDKWEIAYLATYPGCTIDIFNRYGQLVYHSIGYDKPWDGTINGKPAPMGTYYYIVDPKNGRQPISGYVDLIR
jgi:gliding motility-associated-like protein